MNALSKLVFKWLISAAAILATAYILDGISVPNVYIALILAIIIGFLNAIVRPVLIVLTLPVTVITFGLFALVINAFLFWLPSTFVAGYEIENFGWALIGSILVSIFSWFGNKMLENSGDDARNR